MRQKHRRRPRGLRRRHDGQKCRYAPSASTDPVSEYAVSMTYESPASNDEELVLRDVRALLDQLQLDPEHSLVMESRLTDDLGVDSLALVELCDQLERTFDVSLPDEVFLYATTPRQWMEAVVGARGGASARVVDSSGVGPAQPPPSKHSRLNAVLRRVVSSARTSCDARSQRTSRATSSGEPARSATSSVPYALFAWTLLVPFAIGIWLLAVLPLSLAQRRNAGRALARVTCRRLRLSVSVEGALPDAARASVITANHSSFIDGILLYVFLDQPLTFVSSTDMEHQFLVGRIMRGFGCVFVERGRAERSANSVDKLVSTIRGGQHLLIFPEGSISERPGLRVFHLGAFETAASSTCQIVPVGIRGTRDILRPGSFLPHPGAVRIVIGTAIMPTGPEFSDRVTLRDQARDAIARLCGEEP